MVNRIRDRKKGRNGFTLLELLIAVSLMAIGLLAVASMQAVAMRSNLVSNRLTVAASLAQQVAEDVLSYNPSDPRLTTGTQQYLFLTDPATNTTSQQIRIPGAGSYQANYVVTQNQGTTGNTQIVITVQFSYSGTAGSFTNLPFTYTAYKRAN